MATATKIHPSITPERLEAGARGNIFDSDLEGVCLACGEDVYGVEPDAQGYECEGCGARRVMGWEWAWTCYGDVA